MKRTGTALSLLIGLSLLGSGLSYAENVPTVNNSRTYEYVNKWSGDATEGDPITVNYLQGWNQDKVTVGTDGTSQVTIADYGGSNGGEATVLGKNIAFTDGLTTGGTLTAGNAATDRLSAATINAVQMRGDPAGGTVQADAKEISMTGSQDVNATNGSTIRLGTRYMTGDLNIKSLGVYNSSTVDIGNINGETSLLMNSRLAESSILPREKPN